MTNKALSIFNQLRPVTVGFDNVFDHFERMFDDDFTSITAPSFPYYNIVKKSKNNYDIEVALAGYSKDDIEVNLEKVILPKMVVVPLKKESGLKNLQMKFLKIRK